MTATVKRSDPLACPAGSGWGKDHQTQFCSNLSQHARSALVAASVRLFNGHTSYFYGYEKKCVNPGLQEMDFLLCNKYARKESGNFLRTLPIKEL
ncbi:hypothetical protein NQ318_006078 [Aromia moschata]|uniref:Uncharacterized protein n=1 Tax=Aromia moschata TaxID=1265417 RepID=A0AAV8Z2N5_9CUCU|nr:hypothetical protein NQ318_006078 [Aromia moschata]